MRIPRIPSRRVLRRALGPALLLLSAATRAAAADDSVAALRAEIAALRADYDARLAALEARLESIGEPAPAAVAPPAPSVAPPRLADSASGNYFNPAISVLGNLVAVAGHNDVDPSPAAELSEVEIGFQAVVDPYARADVFVAFGEEGAEVEEGYATFTALPAQLLGEAGRMRADFGKVNTLHVHTLPWVDRPLPIVNLLGSEEGWIADGVSLARLIPLGDVFSELTLQAFRGEAEGLFEAPSRGDLAYNAHYRVFGDFAEDRNLEIGLSWATGPNGTDDGARTELAGLDLTYRWKPLRTAHYRGLVLRGELFHSDRETPEGARRSLGGFLSGDVRLGRRWWLGARLESSERADDPELRDDGAALLLAFDPSEFSRLRAEARRRRYAGGVVADELLLQLQFLLGTHGAHPF